MNRDGSTPKRTGRPPPVRLSKEETLVPYETEAPMVGRGVLLQRRMSSCQRYLVVPLGPEEAVVGLVVRFPEGVVQRSLEPRPV